jgi:hypothetical protein
LLLGIPVLGLSLSDLRFFRGVSGPVRVWIHGVDGLPLQHVKVDALNLDKKQVSQQETYSDVNGLAVLVLTPDHGRPAFIRIGTETQRFPDSILSQLAERKTANETTPLPGAIFSHQDK